MWCLDTLGHASYNTDLVILAYILVCLVGVGGLTRHTQQSLRYIIIMNCSRQTSSRLLISN